VDLETKMSFLLATPRKSSLFRALAAERSDVQRAETGDTPAGDEFLFDDSHWVSVWYDPASAVRSDFGTMTAYRAITVHGELLWYVMFENCASVYHVQCDDAATAITRASEAQCEQRQLMDQWQGVQAIARDLLSGKQAFHVTLEDARNAPMCPLGFRTMMASAGLFGFKRISGKTAARMMKAEPQMGFVIYAAWQRTKAEQAAGLVPAPVGYEAMC
jgi:hypothetical protein